MELEEILKNQSQMLDAFDSDKPFSENRNSEYSLAFAETYEILKRLAKSYTRKIPTDILNIIKNYRDKNSSFKFDISKPIAEQNVQDKTLEVITFLNYNYWLNNDEKNDFEKILQKNFEDIEEEKRKKYNPDVFAEKRKREAMELQMQVVNDSFWKKIINKIRELIKK